MTLVSTVVSRNSAVVTGSRRDANIPPTAMSPLPMATSVIATCKSVKAPIDNPNIMKGLIPAPAAPPSDYAAAAPAATGG